MPRLRLLLIMLLTVALDLSPTAPPPHAMTETAEECEDAAHAQRLRRLVRHVRDTTAPKIAHDTRDDRLHRARGRVLAHSRRVSVPEPIRKLPPSTAEAPPAPEDH